MARVVLDKVMKKYEGATDYTIKETSVEIMDREFMILVGPSGCGKSTTLRMIAGLEDITSGKIIIGDETVNDKPPKDRDIAMVFQNYALYPHMNVYDNMAFGLKLRGESKEEINKRVKTAAEILGLEDLLNRRPKQLSGGQRQRVAVGRAIVREPKVFLFDEPLSNLDAKLRVQMRAEIIKLHKTLEKTIVYVTHDQVEAMTMGDRVLIYNAGYVQQVDAPQTVYDRPSNKFVAGFIGSPSMNFLRGKVIDENSLQIEDTVLKIERDEHKKLLIPHKGKDIFFGIRPEDIYLSSNETKLKDKTGNRFKATVDVIEPMGFEAYISLRTMDNSLMARVTMTNLPAYGEQTELIFDMSKCHVFDTFEGKTPGDPEAFKAIV
ncbi:MAG: glycerol-3-phosphate ABC transporter ATP-binding protein [Candidatus Wallbacteria bacterium HGW-Wallbacteria-1]|jgi:multiple sugar transport system ATP-binding protein|uniref:Glycerol-3-phosphate ABC transporter ATP-binding protein n=1 Tax=Candidatus Wallbacteria bacterium HGW-Wallbacteria-1 TaxID=2013854 RepID=A0A2N1PU86_9BACT|nr:MAG: glycerol-3-phosphate ABC transporter ATP-binding protein [Candidatus Wallbacteria bacterium HGW-Wallbacteria-1]